MRFAVSALLLVLAMPAHAAFHSYACRYVGPALDGDARISEKVELRVSEDEATITGVIWDKRQSDSGKFDSQKNGQYAYAGFSAIQDDNFDIRVYVDSSLVEGGRGAKGKLAIWLKGDGEDSADGRYDYRCE